jgi:hypothetical protein
MDHDDDLRHGRVGGEPVDGQAEHGAATKALILLGDVTPHARAAPGRHNQCRNPADGGAGIVGAEG